jgi:hypothetical protein
VTAPSNRHGSAGQTNNFMTGATITPPFTGGVTAFSGGGGSCAYSSSYWGRGGLATGFSPWELSDSGLSVGGTGRCGAGNGHGSGQPGSGVANSGGGGGGRSGSGTNSSLLGGNGGSGVVVIRWVTEG